MKLAVIDPVRMSDDLAARWQQIRIDNTSLSGAYFSLSYMKAISRCRPNVRVGVVNDGEAFFPFQLDAFSFGIARPVGGQLSDYHGLIAESGCTLDVREIVRACGLRGWEFHHVPKTQANFREWKTVEAESHIIDLGRWTGSSESTRRNVRKLEREKGEMTFEFDCRDPSVFATCLRWKSEQYQRTGMFDIFESRRTRWMEAGLREIFNTHQPELSGLLSVVRVAGQPIAAHFGMRSHTDLHYMFPSYDAAFGTYSPGIIMLVNIANAATATGTQRIDLGRGDAVYKKRFATGVIPLLQGCVIVRPYAHALLQARKRMRRSAQSLWGRLRSAG